MTARRSDLLTSLAEEIAAKGQVRPHVIAADLSERGAASQLARDACDVLGAVDTIINNAGVGVGGAQWIAGDRDEARAVFEVNVWSPLALTAALVPSMRAHGRGTVVNVTSVGQVFPFPGLSHYVASKAALGLATQTLRLELEGSGVRVIELFLGPTDTAVQGETRLVSGAERALKPAPLGSPGAAADALVRALGRHRGGTVVFPAWNRPLRAVPALGRTYAAAMRRLADFDPDDPRVVRGGALGDPVARAARDAWDQRG